MSFTENSLIETELIIKIDFSKPFKISESDEPNILKVDFWDEKELVTRNLQNNNKEKKEPKLSKTMELPKMLSEEMAAVMAVAGESVEGSSKATLYTAFFVNFFLGLSMNQLLSTIRCLSYITHLNMMELKLSPISVMFYQKFYEFVTFDIIPTDEIYAEIFDFE